MSGLGIILSLISFFIGAIITYFIIKAAVKKAINESLEDVHSIIREAVVAALSEYEYKKQNRK